MSDRLRRPDAIVSDWAVMNVVAADRGTVGVLGVVFDAASLLVSTTRQCSTARFSTG